MAVEYDQPSMNDDADLDKQQVDFSSIRDSFYILVTMNQYSIKPTNTSKAEAEGLLRMVLYSKDLQLEGTDMTLRGKRQELAKSLRRKRRRNAVPVFISTLWFLFSLAISIQAAFDKLGDNTTAHELAMGLLLAWLPVLVLCSIVDCGSVAANEIRDQINDLVDLVCVSLQNPTIYQNFIDSFRDWPQYEIMKERVTKIRSQSNKLQGGFFTSFAGQGRVRWHYGVAHPILSDIENCYVAEHGRNWLANEEQARMKLVLGSLGRGLFWFDFRELWQISCAMSIVGGCCLGGFVVSYCTPTVGLGCRSLGYLIYATISVGLVVLEFLIWRLTSFSPEDREEERLRQESTGRLNSPRSRRGTLDSQFLNDTTSWAVVQRTKIEDTLIRVVPTLLTTFHSNKHKQNRQDELRRTFADSFRIWHGLPTRQHLHYLFFVPLEIANTVWLIYILLAQTFGLYVNCLCKSSLYGPNGGYVDLAQMNTARNAMTKASWIAGTVISCTIMAVGAGYIVCEWCLQSHLGTEDEGRARRGLAFVRGFRRRVFWLRYPLTCFVLSVNGLRNFLFLSKDTEQKTLIWTRKVTYRDSCMMKSTNRSVANLKDVEGKGGFEDHGAGETTGHTFPVYDAHNQYGDTVSPVGRPSSLGSTNEVFSTPRNSFPPL
jgi:hypothetical protein